MTSGRRIGGESNGHARAIAAHERCQRALAGCGNRDDVFRAALRDLKNVHDAEDVTQAAFVDAYRAVLRGSSPEAPRAWLLAIAENVRRRRFRRVLRGPREEPLPQVAPVLEPVVAPVVEKLNGAAGDAGIVAPPLPSNPLDTLPPALPSLRVATGRTRDPHVPYRHRSRNRARPHEVEMPARPDSFSRDEERAAVRPPLGRSETC